MREGGQTHVLSPCTIYFLAFLALLSILLVSLVSTFVLKRGDPLKRIKCTFLSPCPSIPRARGLTSNKVLSKLFATNVGEYKCIYQQPRFLSAMSLPLALLRIEIPSFLTPKFWQEHQFLTYSTDNQLTLKKKTLKCK